MKCDIEQLMELADFSKESVHRNLLFYELFHTPVPSPDSHEKTLLNMEALGAVAGGNQSTTDFEAFRKAALDILGPVEEHVLREHYEAFLSMASRNVITAEAFLKRLKVLAGIRSSL